MLNVLGFILIQIIPACLIYYCLSQFERLSTLQKILWAIIPNFIFWSAIIYGIAHDMEWTHQLGRILQMYGDGMIRIFGNRSSFY